MTESKKIKVKLGAKIPPGSGFYDFYSKMDILPQNKEEILEVPETPFVKQKLATGELILVTEPTKPPETSKSAKR